MTVNTFRSTAFWFILLTFQVCFTVAYTFWTIDTFADQSAELYYAVPYYDDDEYTWWTPYYISPDANALQYGAQQKRIINTVNALGGQRDLVLSHDSTSPFGTSGSIGFSQGVASVSFTLGYVGGAYFQYDGFDDPATNGGLNVIPGIGAASNVSYPRFSGVSNAQGSIDFTAGGRAAGIAFNASIDLDHVFSFGAFDRNNNSAFYDVDVQASQSYIRYFMPFNNICSPGNVTSNCWRLAPGFLGFTEVNAFQIAVHSFAQSASSIDAFFRNVDVYGNRVFGTISEDCDCDKLNGAEGNVAGQVISLRTGTGTTPSGSILNTTTTDVNGLYEFFDFLSPGTYQVCLETPKSGYTLCTNFTVCQIVVIDSSYNRTITNDFSLFLTPILTAPSSVTIECGDCSSSACLGCAQYIGCGQSIPVCNATDVSTPQSCVVTTTRTFSYSSQSVTQIITTEDFRPPVIFTQPSNLIVQCNTDGSDYTQINAFLSGGYTVSDNCDPSPRVTNNYSTIPRGCNSSQVVSFYAVDFCDNIAVINSRITIEDTMSPLIISLPLDLTVPCDVNATSTFNDWVNNRAGFTALDACQGTDIAYNNSGAVYPGCGASVFVEFSATEAVSCGNPPVTVTASQ